MLDHPVSRRRVLQLFAAGVAARMLQVSGAKADPIPFLSPEVFVSHEDEKAFGSWFNDATRAFTKADWVLLHLAVDVEPFILVQQWRSYAGTIDTTSCTCVYAYDTENGRWTITWDTACPIHGGFVATGGSGAEDGVAITQGDEKRFRAWMAASSALPTSHRLLLHLVPDYTRYDRARFARFGGATYTRTKGQGSGGPGSTSACTCIYDDEGGILYQDKDCPYSGHSF